VCKFALVSFCPHELFPNTRFEMGHCDKRHDEFFKKQFFLLTDDDRLPYELKYIDETVASFRKQISLIDVKIQRALAKNENVASKYDRIPAEYQEKIDSLEVEIKRLLQQAEYLGDAGKIEESERVNEEVQKLKRAKEDLVTLAENPTMVAKQMKVCEVCGAMQATNDTEKRNQTHLEGKVHTGFLKLRAELAKLERRREVMKLHATTQRAMKKEEAKVKVLEKPAKIEMKRRSSSREDRRDKEKDDKKKDKERKRSKERERSREKDRDRRERSREKEKRKRDEPDQSKDRSNNKDKDDKKKKHKKDKKGKRSKSRSRS
jgi:RNA-binding protein Luc7-like 2